MKEVKIEIADKEYKVLIAETEEERIQGLGNVESMDDDEGMLFIMPEDQGQVVFNTEEMEFDIDLVFINQDDEVYNVVLGKAHSSEPIISTPESEEGRTKYVLEVNANSGIKVGDDLEFSPEKKVKMHILDENGNVQGVLQGNERIFSRPNTKTLIKFAKKAVSTELDRDYRELGKRVFKFIKTQDNNGAEYVELKN